MDKSIDQEAKSIEGKGEQAIAGYNRGGFKKCCGTVVLKNKV
jgi:hypothetical protein